MNQPLTRRASILGALSQGLAQPTPPRISIKAQRFTLVDGAGVQIPVQLFDPQWGLYLDVVIIGVNPNKSRIYYENEYDPTKDEPPTCFSDNGIAPSAQATVPQSPTCAACPNAVWGSDTSKMTGKATKLCNDRKKLAVVVVNDPSQLVYQFQVPPASLKNIAVYANALSSHQMDDEERPGMKRPADPADIVTRIYFNPKAQGELLFQPMGFHQQMAPYISALIEKADASGVIDITTGANDVPYQGAIALPNPAVMQALPPPAQQMQAPPPPAPQFVAPQPLMQPAPGQPFGQIAGANGGAQTQPQFQSPAQGTPPPAAPVPRTRRGGARAGAGRPAQNGAPVPQAQPTAAPFQQQAPQQPAQQFAPHGAPAFGVASPPVGQFQPAPQSASFQPQAAQPFTGQATQPATQQGVQEGIPPFLQRPQPAPPAPQQSGAPAFGMTNGAQPDPGLQVALQNAFGAPMQPRQR